MRTAGLSLEALTEENLTLARSIDRGDVSEDFVDTVETLWELTSWGRERRCLGHSFLAMEEGRCVGVILLGEAIPWETDPPEMAAEPFYRLMGFVVDRRCRGRGLGGRILDLAVETKVVIKSGAWYSYNGEKIGQGRDSVKELLKNNEELRNEIEAKVREAMKAPKE